LKKRVKDANTLKKTFE